jgi:predicted XRE-type DNA-binding protein
MPTYDGRELGSTDYRNAYILQWLYWNEELSQREISEIFEVSRSAIKNWMHKMDIQTRSWSEANRGNHKNRHAVFTVTSNGYEKWFSNHKGEQEVVAVHQLLAISEGYDPYEVFDDGTSVHHIVQHPRLNIPKNVVPVKKGEHTKIHHRGENARHAKLTDSQVREIKRLVDSGVKQTKIANEFEVNQSLVSRIKNGVYWSHLFKD